MENKKALELPIAVISPTDIARLLRELDNLDDFFRQSAIRTGGAPQTAPRYSRLLDELVVANGLNLLQQADRDSLMASLKDLSMNAPVLHISFSVDPPGPYVQKIVNWLRYNIRGDVLVRVGLQPNIGAGCVVRTTNKSFDFSLRQFFDSKHDFFMKKLHEVVAPELEDEVYEKDNPDAVVEETAKAETVESAEPVEPVEPVESAEQQSVGAKA